MSILELEQEFTTITKRIIDIKSEQKNIVDKANIVNVPNGSMALYNEYRIDYHRNIDELKTLKARGIDIAKIIGRDRANVICLIVCCTPDTKT